MADKKKSKPRYYPSKEANPAYKEWAPASRAKQKLDFSVPQDVVPVDFKWQDVIPYQGTGDYNTENYKLAANYVPQIMSVFPEMNVNDAIGMAANFLYESGGNPGAREGIIPAVIQPVIPQKMTDPGGFGLLQLTGPRKKAFWDFVGKNPESALDPLQQLAYMKAESEGKIPGMESEVGYYAKARGSKNPAEAAYRVAKFVERPLTADSWPARMEAADSIAKYVGSMEKKKPKPVTVPSQWEKFMDGAGRLRDDAWNSIMSVFK